MKTPDEVRQEFVQEWVGKANTDLKAAEYLLPEPEFVEVTCFHAQQAVEKFLKAILAQKEIEIPKTHNLKALLDLTGLSETETGVKLDEMRVLNAYSVKARYPLGKPMLNMDDAKEAVEIANKVHDAICIILGI